jgi:hypothetical protein
MRRIGSVHAMHRVAPAIHLRAISHRIPPSRACHKRRIGPSVAQLTQLLSTSTQHGRATKHPRHRRQARRPSRTPRQPLQTRHQVTSDRLDTMAASHAHRACDLAKPASHSTMYRPIRLSVLRDTLGVSLGTVGCTARYPRRASRYGCVSRPIPSGCLALRWGVPHDTLGVARATVGCTARYPWGGSRYGGVYRTVHSGCLLVHLGVSRGTLGGASRYT